MLALMSHTKSPDPNALTRWGKQRVRYVFLRQLMQWCKDRPGLGTPNVSGFHAIIGGKKRISWSRFYNDHFLALVEEGYLSHEPDPKTNATALVITQKALDEIDL